MTGFDFDKKFIDIACADLGIFDVEYKQAQESAERCRELLARLKSQGVNYLIRSARNELKNRLIIVQNFPSAVSQLRSMFGDGLRSAAQLQEELEQISLPQSTSSRGRKNALRGFLNIIVSKNIQSLAQEAVHISAENRNKKVEDVFLQLRDDFFEQSGEFDD